MAFRDAEHAEYDPHGGTLLIAPVSCPVPGRPEGAPRLAGQQRVWLRAGSLAARIYGQPEIEEEFTCNYELNPAFQDDLQKAGLQLVGADENGLARIVELEDHPFFVATLFLPQLASREGRPHPLIAAYLDAVVSRRAIQAEH
jgi:CTP synthase (UTP-ammonia lyase)